jgi:hypothetical protein
MKKFIFPLIILTSIFFGCQKELTCDSCTEATLYYTPNCSSINGYVEIFDQTLITYVFQHSVGEAYQKTQTNVCINFTKEENRALTAECVQAEVITIDCIQDLQ